MWIILFCGTVINGGTRIVRCEVLTVVVVKTAVFLDVVPCSAVYINHIKSHHIPEGGSFQYKTSLFVHVISSQKRFIFTLIPIFKHYCYIMNMSLIFTNCYQVCLCVRARVVRLCVCVISWAAWCRKLPVPLLLLPERNRTLDAEAILMKIEVNEWHIRFILSYRWTELYQLCFLCLCCNCFWKGLLFIFKG